MRKSKDALQKHTLQLFEGDYERIQSLHPELSAASVIRQIIRQYILKLDPPVELKIKGDLDV